LDASHAWLHDQRLSLQATADAPPSRRRAAIAERNARLTQQATAMLEAAGHLHHYITTESSNSETMSDGRASKTWVG
jgi:hypothetical protein